LPECGIDPLPAVALAYYGRIFRHQDPGPAFYALGDARTPMLVSAAAIALNFAGAYAPVTRAGMRHGRCRSPLPWVALVGAAIFFALPRQRAGGLGQAGSTWRWGRVDSPRRDGFLCGGARTRDRGDEGPAERVLHCV
jgi:hypothetical protein